MKRITQILASALFVITVLTIYLAFDFAISNAVSNRTSSSRKRLSHDRDHLDKHNLPPDGIKIAKKLAASTSTLFDEKKSNRTIQHAEVLDEQQAHKHKSKEQKRKHPLNAKAAIFHKGKTGIKVNKPRKEVKGHRKNVTTTTTPVPLRNNQDLDEEEQQV